MPEGGSLDDGTSKMDSLGTGLYGPGSGTATGEPIYRPGVPDSHSHSLIAEVISLG